MIRRLPSKRVFIEIMIPEADFSAKFRLNGAIIPEKVSSSRPEKNLCALDFMALPLV
jgi:hypothetical protein